MNQQLLGIFTLKTRLFTKTTENYQWAAKFCHISSIYRVHADVKEQSRSRVNLNKLPQINSCWAACKTWLSSIEEILLLACITWGGNFHNWIITP